MTHRPKAARPFLRLSALLLVVLVGGLAAALAPAARATDPAPVPGLRGELIRALDAARSEVLELANAMPEDKYDWRPGKGVRSVGEVYQHIAQANYSLPHLAGVDIPKDVDLKQLGTGNLKLSKAETIDLLTKSFAHAEQAFTSASDADLDKPIKIFGRDGTVREAFLLTCTHAHEHLGQSIAYARTNGVVPPWTARADSAAAAKKAAGAAGAKPADKP